MTAQLTTEPATMASDKITHATIMITPEMAARWLKYNTRNRPVRRSVIARYHADMDNGLWTFAADPIRFDADGVLVDGQHRLHALSQMPDGFSLRMLVVRGLPPESQRVMDQGAKRTPGDQLSLSGLKNSHAVAAAVKKYLVWERGLLFRDGRIHSLISSPQIEEWVSAHADLVEFFNSLWGLIHDNDAPPSVAGQAALKFAQIDPDACEEFFTALARGGTGEGHPINTLDKRLQRNRRQGIKMSDRDYLALIIVAWNAWRDGREMRKFYRPRGGTFTADTFPTPR